MQITHELWLRRRRRAAVSLGYLLVRDVGYAPQQLLDGQRPAALADVADHLRDHDDERQGGAERQQDEEGDYQAPEEPRYHIVRVHGDDGGGDRLGRGCGGNRSTDFLNPFLFMEPIELVKASRQRDGDAAPFLSLRWIPSTYTGKCLDRSCPAVSKNLCFQRNIYTSTSTCRLGKPFFRTQVS